MSTFNPTAIAKAVLPGILGEVLRRSDVPVPAAQVPETVSKITTAINAGLVKQDVAIVPVKSAWLSKINITAAIAAAIALLAAFGVAIPAEWQVTLVKVVAVFGPILTIVLKTWFTNTVTPSSLPTPPAP